MPLVAAATLDHGDRVVERVGDREVRDRASVEQPEVAVRQTVAEQHVDRVEVAEGDAAGERHAEHRRACRRPRTTPAAHVEPVDLLEQRRVGAGVEPEPTPARQLRGRNGARVAGDADRLAVVEHVERADRAGAVVGGGHERVRRVRWPASALEPPADRAPGSRRRRSPAGPGPGRSCAAARRSRAWLRGPSEPRQPRSSHDVDRAGSSSSGRTPPRARRQATGRLEARIGGAQRQTRDLQQGDRHRRGRLARELERVPRLLVRRHQLRRRIGDDEHVAGIAVEHVDPERRVVDDLGGVDAAARGDRRHRLDERLGLHHVAGVGGRHGHRLPDVPVRRRERQHRGGEGDAAVGGGQRHGDGLAGSRGHRQRDRERARAHRTRSRAGRRPAPRRSRPAARR